MKRVAGYLFCTRRNVHNFLRMKNYSSLKREKMLFTFETFSDLSAVSAGKCLTDDVFAYCMEPLLNRACGPRASCMCLALNKRYSPSNPSHHTALGYGLPIFLPIFTCV